MPFLPQKTVPPWRKYNCVRISCSRPVLFCSVLGLFCSRPAFAPRIYSQQMAHDFSEAVFPQIQMPSGRDNVIFIVLTLPLCHVSLHRKRNPSLKGPMLVIRGPIKGCEVSSVLHFWLIPTFPPNSPGTQMVGLGNAQGNQKLFGGKVDQAWKREKHLKKEESSFLAFLSKTFPRLLLFVVVDKIALASTRLRAF